MISSLRISFIILTVVFYIDLHSQTQGVYNFLPYSKIEVNEPPTQPNELYKSKHWFGLKGVEGDLLDSQGGFYPDFISKVFYYKNYLGLMLYNPRKKQAQTFAVSPLQHPLEEGKKYTLIIEGYLPFSSTQIDREIREQFKIHKKQEIPWNDPQVQNMFRNMHTMSLGYALTRTEPHSLQELRDVAVTQTKISYNYFSFAFDFTAKEPYHYLTIGNFLQDPVLSKNNPFLTQYVLIYSVKILSQENKNIIPNADFELFSELPRSAGEWWKLKEWFSPHANRLFHEYLPSPDFIHKQIDEGVVSGESSARVGYINMDTIAFNEALSVRLKNPLQKGQRYFFSANLCHANLQHRPYSWSPKKYRTDLDSLKIQFGLDIHKPVQSDKHLLSPAQVINYSKGLGGAVCDKISIDFVANDDYEYFTIGYFEELDIPMFAEAGVYFDDLSLYEIPTNLDSAYIASIKKNNTVKKPPEPLALKEPEKPVLQDQGLENNMQKQYNTRLDIKHDVVIKGSNCSIELYDHGTEDGDIITLVVNGKVITEHLTLKRRPTVAKFEISLKPGYNTIFPIAENLGRIPPNTVHLYLKCLNGQEKEYKLFSKPGESEVLRIRLAEN